MDHSSIHGASMAKFQVVAIEGDVMNRLPEIVRVCSKKPEGSVKLFGEWGSAASHLRAEPWYVPKNLVVAGIAGGWTVLADDVHIGGITDLLFKNKELGLELARRLKTRVVSAVGNDTSCMYGFRIYCPDHPRYVLVHETVEENIGEPIPGEPELRFPSYTEDEVLEVLGLLGIDIEEGLEDCTESALIHYSDLK
jgi:hypothetical protein